MVVEESKIIQDKSNLNLVMMEIKDNSRKCLDRKDWEEVLETKYIEGVKVGGNPQGLRDQCGRMADPGRKRKRSPTFHLNIQYT